MTNGYVCRDVPLVQGYLAEDRLTQQPLREADDLTEALGLAWVVRVAAQKLRDGHEPQLCRLHGAA